MTISSNSLTRLFKAVVIFACHMEVFALIIIESEGFRKTPFAQSERRINNYHLALASAGINN